MSKQHPVRMCIVCGRKRSKQELVRIVMNGGLLADIKQVAPGRGRYICRDGECPDKLRDGKILRRAFRARALDSSAVAELMESLKAPHKGQHLPESSDMCFSADRQTV